MSPDILLNAAQRIDWRWPLAGLAAVVVLLVLARIIRRIGRGDVAGRVTTFATVLGLGWSAQGMLDTAISRYGQPVLVAGVLFVVFEAWIVGRMLRARQYRTDYARRAKFVRTVWLGASVMAVVVALGEGWSQAPGRLAIPLLVAYGWYTDLTADDDPGEKPRTSLRWTPRRLALWVGAIEAGERDARTIDRDRHVNRMTGLAFRIQRGDRKLTDLFHREVRLSKLALAADDDMVREMHRRLARAKSVLAAPDPQSSSLIIPPRRRIQIPPAPDSLPMGTHEIDGRILRGRDLHADATARMIASVSPERPRGMPIAELAALYTPALKQRTAETIAASARKQINGHSPS